MTQQRRGTSRDVDKSTGRDGGRSRVTGARRWVVHHTSRANAHDRVAANRPREAAESGSNPCSAHAHSLGAGPYRNIEPC